MPIQDSSPERRNLTVTAASIILFYIAGAEFTDQKIRLQIINVHFTNPSVLSMAIWGLLIWFVFRYWQKYRGDLNKTFFDFVSGSRQNKICQWYLAYVHKIKKPLEEECSIYTNFEKKDKQWLLHYTFRKDVSFHSNGSISSYHSLPVNNPKTDFVVIGSLFKLFIFPYNVARAFVLDTEFVTVLTPYLLFILAITLGAFNWIFGCTGL